MLLAAEGAIKLVLGGLQKVTLLDYPGKVACTVFTEGCNFRCPFCHNASLVLPERRDQTLPEEEFFRFLGRRKGILDGVCVTGGEPMLQKDLPEFLSKLRELGFLVKLDTNGSFPERLRAVLEAGLADYVAMDLKNSPERYGETIGVPDFDLGPIRESVALLLENRVAYEFRTTVVRGLHREEDFPQIAAWIAGAEHYFLQGFVDSGDLVSGGWEAFSREEMAHFAELVREKVPSVQLRGITD